MTETNFTKLEIPISGMTCANCAAKIDKTLKNLPGMNKSSVNIATDTAILEFDFKQLNFVQIKNSIEGLGYKVFATNENSVENDLFEKESNLDLKKQKFKFKLAISLSLFIMLISMNIPSLPNDPTINLIKYFSLFLMASVVVLYSGYQFFVGFVRSLKNLYPDMNTLIAIGTGSAFVFSTYVLISSIIQGHLSHSLHLYYDTSSTIISFVLLGKLLEKSARGKSSLAIRNLLKLQPKQVKVLRNNFEMIVPAEFVEVGDIVSVTPGEKIPVDGKIITGSSFIDESFITGESLPIEKKAGDIVIGGTINKFGILDFVAEKVGKDTYLSQIIQLVKDAQNSKPPIQKYADKIASIFVPTIILIAILTFVYWYLLSPQKDFSLAMLNFVSVLIVACPCALGLATPTAIITGIGKAAQNGIFFRNNESLELMRNLTTIVFDKTGTLTKGDLEVIEIIPFGAIERDELLQTAASCEYSSEHPIGKAIVKFAKENDIDTIKIDDFEAVSGFGIHARIKDAIFLIGNASLMTVNNIPISTDLSENILIKAKNGITSIIIAKNQSVIGLILVSDVLKDNVKSVIGKLKDLNLETVLLTGDSRGVAETVGIEIGIDHLYAGVKPEEKLNIIKKMQVDGKTIAMVGDGINDAPALIQSDIGIAMGSGTDVAISSSDITIARNDLESVFKAILISKKMMIIIKQNLFWAFFYNVVCIPLAAGAFIPLFNITLNPSFAALAMAFSSVSVVANSLRLRIIK